MVNSQLIFNGTPRLWLKTGPKYIHLSRVSSRAQFKPWCCSQRQKSWQKSCCFGSIEVTTWRHIIHDSHSLLKASLALAYALGLYWPLTSTGSDSQHRNVSCNRNPASKALAHELWAKKSHCNAATCWMFWSLSNSIAILSWIEMIYVDDSNSNKVQLLEIEWRDGASHSKKSHCTSSYAVKQSIRLRASAIWLLPCHLSIARSCGAVRWVSFSRKPSNIRIFDASDLHGTTKGSPDQGNGPAV